MKRAVALVALALLAGCSHAPKSGYVVGKKYDPPYTWMSSMCAAYSKYGACMVSVPYPVNEPPHWTIRIRSDDGTQTGDTELDQSTWDRVRVGQHWPDAA